MELFGELGCARFDIQTQSMELTLQEKGLVFFIKTTYLKLFLAQIIFGLNQNK
jgi:hypothetical protein